MDHRFGDRFGGNPLSHLLDKALKNTQSELKKARQEGETDSLTGLYNRRALNRQFLELIKRIKNEGGEYESDPDYILFFFIDLDKLKALNDTRGHIVGDEALKLTAKIVEEEAQGRGGIAVRLGGDEFALVQAGKGNLTDSIEVISSRIQTKINSKIIADGRFDNTVSVGCVPVEKKELQEDGDKYGKTAEEILEIVIRQSDKRMYAEKIANGSERGK